MLCLPLGASVILGAPVLTLVSPTETNASVIYPRTYGIINSTIDSNNLSYFKLNWNGTNYTLYDNYTILHFGLDNNAILGENRTVINNTAASVITGNYIGSEFFDGTIATEGKWNTSGYWSSGLTSNGSVGSALGLVYSTPINKNLTSWTVTTWIKPFSNPLLNYGSIWALYNNPYFGRLWVKGTTNEVVQRFGAAYEYPGITLTNNQWIHLAYVCNSSNQARVYYNGTLSAATLTCLTGNYSNNLSIGENPNSFNGTMDALRLYPWTLSASEISLDMNSNKPIGNGTLVDYEFEEGTGSIARDTNTLVAGKYNGAYKFTGSTYMNLTNATSLNITGPITISAWINPQVITGVPNIINKDSPINGGYGLSLEYSATCFTIQSGGTSWEVCGTTIPSIGTWQYVTGVFDGSLCKIYYNGLQENAPIACGPMTTSTSNVMIGRNTQYTNRYFTGAIDEVRVWNRSLSSDEVWMQYLSNLQKFNATQYQFYSNRSALASSSYTFYTWANATDATSGQSETRIFYTKPYNTLTLASSPSWSTLKGTVALSCSALQGTPLLWLQGYNVLNPYSFTADTGTYSVSCNTPETTTYSPTNTSNNLLIASLTSCTNLSTYAFNATISTATNITTINMTALVSSTLVKSDLSDVQAVGVTSSWVNLTGASGQYLVVNNTGLTSFTLNFGNYLINNSYTSSSINNTQNLTTYTNINKYLMINILDEINGSSTYPPTSTVIASITCDQGQNYFTIQPNITRILVALLDDPLKITLRPQYSATDYYYRARYNFLSQSAYSYDIYLADGTVYTIVPVIFIMQDVNKQGKLLQIYKVLGNQTQIISEGYFDISSSDTEYLIQGVDYKIRVLDSLGAVVYSGDVNVPQATTKYLYTSTQNLTPLMNFSSQYLYKSAYFVNSSAALSNITVNYTDVTLSLSTVTITIYNNSGIVNTSVIPNTNNFSVTALYNANTSESYYVKFSISHPGYGTVTDGAIITGTFRGFNLGISASWLSIIAITILLMVMMSIGGPTTIIPSGIVMFALWGLFMAMGWIVLTQGQYLALIILLIVGMGSAYFARGER
jgi:hypothetical protein